MPSRHRAPRQPSIRTTDEAFIKRPTTARLCIVERRFSRPSPFPSGDSPLVAQRLDARRAVAPHPAVGLDRIDLMPFRELFPVERGIGLVAQRLDVLDVEFEPD